MVPANLCHVRVLDDSHILNGMITSHEFTDKLCSQCPTTFESESSTGQKKAAVHVCNYYAQLSQQLPLCYFQCRHPIYPTRPMLQELSGDVRPGFILRFLQSQTFDIACDIESLKVIPRQPLLILSLQSPQKALSENQEHPHVLYRVWAKYGGPWPGYSPCWRRKPPSLQ